MPYTINRTNGLQITVVQDGTIDTKSLDITLVGKNYTGYGEAFNENFVKLLENFSNNKQPVKPLSGQLWYDSVGKRISVYNGTKFRPLGVVVSSSTRPATTDSTSGDLWWDTANKQLNAFNGSSYVTIGPMNTKIGNTGAIPSTALNSDNNTATPIIKDTINSTIAFVSYAGPHFNVDHTDDVYLSSGISFIQPGITLSGSDATFGVSVTDVPTRAGYMLWGTAASALRLVRSDNISHSADEFLLTSELAALQGQILINNDDGLVIGNSPVVKFHITRVGGNNIANASVFNGSIFNINANTTAGGSYTNIVSFDASNGLKVLPNPTTPVTIGTAGIPFDSVYARNMYANTLTVSTFIYDQQEIDSVTLRASGMSYANTFSGSGANLTNIPNTALVNSGAVQVLASTGLTGGGNVAPGGSITITNVGVTSLVAGTDITINRSTGTVTVTSAATLKSVTDLGATTDNIVQLTNGTDASSVSSGALQVTGGVGITGNLYVGGTMHGYATSAGNLTGGSVTGNYTLDSGARFEATYADLAERYAADAIYEPGTVLVIGGSAEVTTTTRRGDTSIAGIVSTNPAYTLNATAGGNDTHPYIALKGRVPCKVIGPIKKGDLLITSNQAGYAQASTMFSSANAMLGRALQDFNGITGVIEVMVI